MRYEIFLGTTFLYFFNIFFPDPRPRCRFQGVEIALEAFAKVFGVDGHARQRVAGPRQVHHDVQEAGATLPDPEGDRKDPL